MLPPSRPPGVPVVITSNSHRDDVDIAGLIFTAAERDLTDPSVASAILKLLNESIGLEDMDFEMVGDVDEDFAVVENLQIDDYATIDEVAAKLQK